MELVEALKGSKGSEMITALLIATSFAVGRDVGRLNAETLRTLPGVPRVSVPVSVAKPQHRIIHILDWHYVQRPRSTARRTFFDRLQV